MEDSFRHRIDSPVRLLVIVTTICCLPALSLGSDYDDFFSFNGSFEEGPASTGVGLYSYPIGVSPTNYYTTKVTGWRLYGSAPPKLFEGPEAQDGDRYIGLTTRWNAGGKSMGASIDGSAINHTPFEIGESYELIFWAAGGAGTSNAVSMGINGMIGQVFDLPESTLGNTTLYGPQWERYVLPFVATNTTLYLSLAPVNDHLHPGYSSSVYLDNFSIVHVPEPASLILFMTGGLLFSVQRRREKRH